jgi:Family of unknown function (DUF6283)
MINSTVRSQACSACPYRKDCPSGLWAAHEYNKLRDYDNITPDQPWAPFMCHATPDHLCHGWAVVHTNRGHEYDLLALRMIGYPEVPEPSVPLFASGNEAANHGQKDIEAPSAEAIATAERLVRKFPRLQQ